MRYSLNELYRVVGISKQAVLKYEREEALFQERLGYLAAEVYLLRSDHPGCGLEKMYHILKPDFLGRDRFVYAMKRLGYGLKKPRAKHRTTYPGNLRHPNLIEGLVVQGPCEVWQSDLTYYRIGETFYYIVFLIDVYTKCIVGHRVSHTRHAEANVRAFQRAVSIYGAPKIHHSDRGIQYCSHVYIDALKSHKVRISMCRSPQENAYAERINRTIKEEYLDLWKPKSGAHLKRLVTRAVNNYNQRRPHNHLRKRTPFQALEDAQACPREQRQPMKIFKKQSSL